MTNSNLTGWTIGAGSPNHAEDEAFCNTGETVIGGGGSWSWGALSNGNNVQIMRSYPQTYGGPLDAWVVDFGSVDGATDINLVAYAICMAP